MPLIVIFSTLVLLIFEAIKALIGYSNPQLRFQVKYSFLTTDAYKDEWSLNNSSFQILKQEMYIFNTLRDSCRAY